MLLNSIQRIMIFGKPGAGKSTFALKLHHKLGLPLYHLDKYFFTNRWKKRNYDDFMRIQQNLVNQEQWIIDGNCTRSLATRFARADVCLYFNYPRWRCMLGILKRRFTKDPTIQDRADECYEKVTAELISYLWTFEIRVHDAIANLQTQYPHVRLIEIHSQEDLDAFFRLL